jgi:hypothetical protein
MCLRSLTQIVKDMLVQTQGQLTPERPALLWQDFYLTHYGGIEQRNSHHTDFYEV